MYAAFMSTEKTAILQNISKISTEVFFKGLFRKLFPQDLKFDFTTHYFRGKYSIYMYGLNFSIYARRQRKIR